MATRIGKYKVSKRESAMSLVDGGTPEGPLFKANSSPTGTTTVLTNDDSGKVIFMDASSANTITLPAVSTVSAGWNLKVILTATGAAGIVQTSSTEDKLAGYVEESAANGSNHTLSADADADTITFVNGAVPGDWVDIHSNGTLFYVFGKSAAENKITLTKED